MHFPALLFNCRFSATRSITAQRHARGCCRPIALPGNPAHSAAERLDGNLLIAFAREHHDRRVSVFFLAAEPVDEFQAAQVRQVIVEQDAIRLFLVGERNPSSPTEASKKR